ncbi:MAG: DMT family transporter [Gemmobacter sp.]|nr:DMT family transporter [Gemmobacter sp.]
MARRQGNLRTPGAGWRWLVLRGCLLFLANASYYLALAALPLATTVALYFAAPLMMVALAALLLGPARWLAVGCGFAGVLIVVRPGSSLFDWASLLPVFAGLNYALSMVLSRRLGMQHSAAVQAFHGNLVLLLGALLLSVVFGGGGHPSLAFLIRGWVMPAPGDFLLMITCGAIAAGATTLLTQAYRIASPAAVAPFEYSGMIWGVVWGWLFWSDWPDAVAWTGITSICGTGLFVVWHEAGERRVAARSVRAA